ncbi:MucB/RseB C-terminal domain-containing protein [Pseudothauera rhizosphaerae]|uniref:Siderophore-interacting protein n=1 Tax=Pseudothauera rhizosphaerae TaxID=2565932 RepID=A0A4S4AR18_9RHOO|nr:MucB/RseB C-terminal domain-containing protein [Pseudothauera rhizosphaerae]THF60886.1 siderophore-interacting protein [Pseudothauera rhizosphaerae]
MRRLAAVLCLGAAFATPAWADAPADPLSWLGRIASASRQLNYSGTFTYQAGGHFETSRIVHLVDATGEHERLEVLDGSPREVIRSNSEVRCVLPEQKMVIIDEAGGRRAFPARIPASFAGLAESYRIRKGGSARVAGYESQLIVLDPRDDLRYGHQFWSELQSGLLLKARMVDERGELIEQFTFSEVRIGEVDRESLSPRYRRDDEWRVVNTRGSEMAQDQIGWTLHEPLPGFALTSVVRRSLGAGRGEVVHMVYSDGLAAISVFIEPLDASEEAGDMKPQRSGSINIYKRRVNGHLVTALGEVPQRAVMRMGDAIEAIAR